LKSRLRLYSSSAISATSENFLLKPVYMPHGEKGLDRRGCTGRHRRFALGAALAVTWADCGARRVRGTRAAVLCHRLVTSVWYSAYRKFGLDLPAGSDHGRR
jgi:hypothetical protein